MARSPQLSVLLEHSSVNNSFQHRSHRMIRGSSEYIACKPGSRRRGRTAAVRARPGSRGPASPAGGPGQQVLGSGSFHHGAHSSNSLSRCSAVVQARRNSLRVVLCLHSRGGDHKLVADPPIQAAPAAAPGWRPQPARPRRTLDRAGVRIAGARTACLELGNGVVPGGAFALGPLGALRLGATRRARRPTATATCIAANQGAGQQSWTRTRLRLCGRSIPAAAAGL